MVQSGYQLGQGRAKLPLAGSLISWPEGLLVSADSSSERTFELTISDSNTRSPATRVLPFTAFRPDPGSSNSVPLGLPALEKPN